MRPKKPADAEAGLARAKKLVTEQPLKESSRKLQLA
jgi:hypothetical protein